MKIASVLKIAGIVVGLIIAIIVIAYFYLLFEYTSALPVNNPSEYQIESYGRDKFVNQALEFKETGEMNEELSRTFRPKRIELYGYGVLLVFAENKNYIKGLCVEPEEYFGNSYGSGTAITFRSKHIGVVEVKKRIPVSGNLKGLGYASSNIDANDL